MVTPLFWRSQRGCESAEGCVVLGLITGMMEPVRWREVVRGSVHAARETKAVCRVDGAGQQQRGPWRVEPNSLVVPPTRTKHATSHRHTRSHTLHFRFSALRPPPPNPTLTLPPYPGLVEGVPSSSTGTGPRDGRRVGVPCPARM